MSSHTSRVLAEAMRLSLQERADLAAALLASLDGEPEEDVEQAWAREVERRARRALAGETSPEDWDEVYRKLRQRQRG
jgi:putative addiction module component (TIGR02574 family)